MSLKVLDVCFGCGGCETPCPHGAITQVDDFAVRFTVDPVACNDCGLCVPLCPVDALVVDPEYAICHGRGCPMNARRLAGLECSEGAQLCDRCGAVLWRMPENEAFECPRCDFTMAVICPKTRKVEAIAD